MNIRCLIGLHRPIGDNKSFERKNDGEPFVIHLFGCPCGKCSWMMSKYTNYRKMICGNGKTTYKKIINEFEKEEIE